MKTLFVFLYNLALALWVGGVAIFTFIVTPAIFRSYGRDQAGEIVGRLFPGYFAWTAAVTIFALALFLLLNHAHLPMKAARTTAVLLAGGVLISLFVALWVYPKAVEIKKSVVSFERESKDSPARRSFARLHGLSAALNLLLLADGLALLFRSTAVKEP